MTQQVEAAEQPAASRGAGRGVAMAAVLLMIGNLASRVFGQVRESVIGSHFSGSAVSLYGALGAVPTQLYDFLVGGLVSAALVPVFSDYLETEDTDALNRLISTVLTLVLLALLLVGGMTALAAPWVARFIATDAVTAANLGEAVTMLRIMIGAVMLMGLSGLLTGLLQARQRFLLPAFTTSAFNIGMIAVVVLLSDRRPTVLAVGMLAGAGAQALLQLPGLRNVRLRPMLDLRHPGVRRIGRLYAPVALGIGFSLVGTLIDRRLASSEAAGPDAVAYMRWATTLIQFTLGMVAAAISLAILPTLARLNTAGDEAGFRRVFGLGLKTVVLLAAPAVVALGLLGAPIIDLLYNHGPEWSAEKTRITTLALWVYLPSLLAAAIDQPLIFAFYARKHTLLPNLVQGAAIAAYCAVALLSFDRWGMYGLIGANVVQWVGHALLMAWLARRRLDLFNGQRFGAAFAKIAAAAAVMALVLWGVRQLFPAGTLSQSQALLLLVAGGGVASAAYFGLLWRLRLDALEYFTAALTRRFKRSAA